MAWGYEASFTIEHIRKDKAKLSCSDCYYYDKSDKSCGKSPRYLPVDGYDSWRYCGQFRIDEHATYKEEKSAQYNAWIRKKVSKESVSKVESQEKVKKSSKDKTMSVIEACSNCELRSCVNFKEVISKPKVFKTLPVYLDDGKKINVELCISKGFVYVRTSKYSKECLDELCRLLKKSFKSNFEECGRITKESSPGVLFARNYKTKEMVVLTQGQIKKELLEHLEYNGWIYDETILGWRKTYEFNEFHSTKELFKEYNVKMDLINKVKSLGLHISL